MKIAIVDDAPEEAQRLSRYVKDYCAAHSVVARVQTFSSGEALLERFAPGEYDLIFLDIRLPGVDGMETARRLRAQDGEFLLVFCTASSRHAVESFQVRAFHYLLKPYTRLEFDGVMALCDRALLKRPAYIRVREGRMEVRVFLQEILYADYSNHYVQIHTALRTIRSYMPFARLEELLAPYPQFLSCYRNCLVNMDAVRGLDELGFLLPDGEIVPVRRSARAQVRQRYTNYLFLKRAGELRRQG